MKTLIALATLLAAFAVHSQPIPPARIAGIDIHVDQGCIGNRGQDGYVATVGPRATGCMDAQKAANGGWRVQWDQTNRVQYIGVPISAEAREEAAWAFWARSNSPYANWAAQRHYEQRAWDRWSGTSSR